MASTDNKEMMFLAGALGVSAAMFYKGSRIRKTSEEAKVSVIAVGGKLIQAKPIKIDLPESALKKASEAQKLALGTKANTEKKLAVFKRPTTPIRLADKIPLSDIRENGLLGRLVAQYYAFERARLFYMTRCGAYHFSDDTPVWLQREKQLVSKSDIDKKLKDPKWFGVGLENANYLDRWDGGSSKSKLWRRRYSLEATFCNWSGPPFIGSGRYQREGQGIIRPGSSFCKYKTHSGSNNYVVRDKPIDYPLYWVDGNTLKPRTCPPKNSVLGAGQFCRNNQLYYRDSNHTSMFFHGGYPFGSLMAHRVQNVVAHGYQYPDNVTSGDYSEVCAKEFYTLDAIPWRNFKGVSINDRLKATYTLPVEHDPRLRDERAHRIGRYYEFGYYLVRTVLDVLCANGKTADQFPGFAEHCTWWCIPQPTAEFVARYPDLTVIGSGVQGLHDVKLKDLVKYVMQITPKPGTIAPWEDKGPLWSWPESTGHLQPLPINRPFKLRVSDDVWGTIVQYILSFETSICSNVASGVANAVISEAVKWAESICSEWINEGISVIMDNLNNEFTKTAISEIKEIIKDVSGFGANMSRFLDAKELIAQLPYANNLVDSLSNYLDLSTYSQYGDVLSRAKTEAQGLIDGIRKEWDWADELLGSAASIGRSVTSDLSKNFPSEFY